MKKLLNGLLLSVMLIAIMVSSSGCVALLAGAAAGGGTYYYMETHKECAYCKKQIPEDATICPHCQKSQPVSRSTD